MNRKRIITLALVVLVLTCATACGAQELSNDEASEALKKAVEFFRRGVSGHGGYLWRYSADLARREGEGRASASQAWVQPPGTPSVGSAYLQAYELTGDTYYLEAARETAVALVQGQLQSGGWEYRICFDPEDRAHYAYRVEPTGQDGRNTSTLDDDTTQSAVRFLMRTDQALGLTDEPIHEATLYALESLLNAQYPNGAWPQRFSAPPDPEQYPVKKASYPESWSRTFPKENYAGYYTFNDNTIADTIRTMFDAAEVYQDERYRAAAEKAGDFILMAQMPDPQPAWAQQYNADMHPAWARKFEPPSITGGESQGVMRTLLYLYRQTGERRFLDAVQPALDYLKNSRLPDEKLARFYELKTNTPLYFTKGYELTYSSDDLPTHYGFIVGSSLDAIEAEYESLKSAHPASPKAASSARKPDMTPELAAQAKAVVDGMDERGAWVEEGRLRYHGENDPTTHIIDSRTFWRNVLILSRFVAASR
jgi:hypothetical protein